MVSESKRDDGLTKNKECNGASNISDVRPIDSKKDRYDADVGL